MSLLKIFSSTGIANDPVFPLPVSARANRSLPSRMIGIVNSWIGEAFSNPFEVRLFKSFSLRDRSEKGTDVSIVISLFLVIIEMAYYQLEGGSEIAFYILTCVNLPVKTYSIKLD